MPTRHFGCSLIPVIIATILGFAQMVSRAPYSVDETLPYKAKWAKYGSPNYIINVSGGGVLPYSRVLEFRKNAFVSQKNDPNCPYPESFCNQPLTSPERYSIDNLFEIARKCINRTKAKYVSIYPFSVISFHGFKSERALQNFVQEHEAQLARTLTLQSLSVCAVEYDPTYGYPKIILFIIPGAIDGISVLGIQNLTFPAGEFF